MFIILFKNFPKQIQYFPYETKAHFNTKFKILLLDKVLIVWTLNLLSIKCILLLIQCVCVRSMPLKIRCIKH